MFTCISYWHRYNMKRRVANLPPVAATVFNDKVLERREQNAVRVDPRDLFCSACSKSFSTENAYRTHVQSKKHRDREAQGSVSRLKSVSETLVAAPGLCPSHPHNTVSVKDGDESEEDEDEDDAEIEDRIATARRRIQPSDCLFCPTKSTSISENIRHMSITHSFFIPDQDLLVNQAGLLSYLGEKVVIGNLCLFCPNGGKEFGNLEAVRRHMIDKSHCKLAYETDEDRAELADFYEFNHEDDDGSDWEEVEAADEERVFKESSGISLAADGLSLLLPSGRTLGHRSLKVYYSQHFRPHPDSSRSIDPSKLKVQQLRLRLADPSQALVPVSGGQGAYGRGLQVIKARNAGEAKWARKQGRSFKDQRVKEALKTRVGFVHNSQKHFRDPLLQ